MSEPTFRDVVRTAFVATVRKADDPEEYAERLAHELRLGLRAAGYEIHRSGNCVSRKYRRGEAPVTGRPMTDAEAEAVGLR